MIEQYIRAYVVRGRCAMDPCASNNGTKMRAFGFLTVPLLVGVGGYAALSWPISVAPLLVAVVWSHYALSGIGEVINRLNDERGHTHGAHCVEGDGDD